MKLDDWALSPEVMHLNHGSYGGCPSVVLDHALQLRRTLEAAPMQFFGLSWQTLVDGARTMLAKFVGAEPEKLVFVPNATSGVAIALHSVELAAGDEIATTNHTYRAIRNQLERLAAARGARLVVVTLALPFDPDAAVAAIAAAVTPRTRAVVLDHVTSPTALVLPLERILPPLHARGITTVIDGAHAAGQIALDVGALGATYYAGNNHKWLCAPKASGFLVARGPLRPIVTSHGASASYGPANRLHAELDWAGTYDPTSQLCVPTAILATGDWAALRARNLALALELRDQVRDAFGSKGKLAPDDSLGAMAALPVELPAGTAPLPLTQELLRQGWELPIVDWPGQPLVRISAHAYNEASDAAPLIAKLQALAIRVL
ncbi:MAG: aminotransferase class V-fold PLP-dependent enzyme [Kofleriaceae bacterium]